MDKQSATLVRPRFSRLGFGHYGYVALYCLDGDAVIVVAIRHQLDAGYRSD